MSSQYLSNSQMWTPNKPFSTSSATIECSFPFRPLYLQQKEKQKRTTAQVILMWCYPHAILLLLHAKSPASFLHTPSQIQFFGYLLLNLYPMVFSFVERIITGISILKTFCVHKAVWLLPGFTNFSKEMPLQ